MRNSQSAPHRHKLLQSPAPPALPAPAVLSEPTRTVLVVDDNPRVRELEAEVLRLEGFTVLQAESASEALQLAGSTATIHLLITDFIMPEVDGLELTRQFRAVHPTTPVLMVSASLPMLPSRGEEALNRFEFLAKPFHFNELLHKVRTLLDTVVPLPIRKPRRVTNDFENNG